jgi:signal transduction histidine kinase
LASARLAFGVAAILFFAQAGPAVAQAPAERPWRVVVLNDGDPTLPAFIAIDRGLRAVLSAPGKHPVDVFYETLDVLRFPEALFERELVAMLAKKYETSGVDAVVAIGISALRFAEKHRDRLWPEAPVLFSGVPPDFLRERRLPPGATGFSRAYDLAGAAEIALRLRPSTRRLVVISGTSEFDRTMAHLARTQLEPYAERVALEYWQDAPIGELLRRVARLGREDAVLYLTIGRDADGHTFTPRAALERLSAASAAPIYGPFETYIGHGIVAGNVYGFETSGKRVGELLHEVLSAPRGAPLPPVSPGESFCIADADQMERFGLSAGGLPPGCELRYTRPSLWREYRWYVVGALLVILAQSALILGLVLQRRGRIRAEGEVRHRRAELAQASRLALAGELTASIAHEINQPLGAILANAGAAEALLRRDPAASEELRAILADIQRADLRASEIIRRVRALVSARPAEREPVDVNATVSEVLAFLQGETTRREVVVHAALAAGLPALLADRVQLQQAVVNLCLNAMEAMMDCAPGERRLGVRTDAADGGGVEIAVSDTGPGIPAEHLKRVFDSFFTTKAHGTGLGLAITHSIVEAHGGRVSAENRAEGGVLFTMTLPASAA